MESFKSPFLHGTIFGILFAHNPILTVIIALAVVVGFSVYSAYSAKQEQVTLLASNDDELSMDDLIEAMDGPSMFTDEEREKLAKVKLKVSYEVVT